MRAEHQRQIIERVLAHLANGGTDAGPFGRRVGTDRYTREDLNPKSRCQRLTGRHEQ
jgi:hypothetical protein